MVNILVLRIANLLVAFNVFICLSGLLFYGLKILHTPKTKRPTYFIVYFLFFLLAIILNIGNWFAFNLVSIWQAYNIVINEMVLIFLARVVNTSLTIGFLILALALRMEFAEESRLVKRFWYIIMIFGVIVSIFHNLSQIEVLSVEGGFPLLGYTPSVGVNLIILFVLIIGIWYGFQTVNNYLGEYRQQYSITSFHYLFLVVSIFTFLGMGISIALRFMLAELVEFRTLTFAMVSTTLVVFPTLRWTYIEHYHRRVIDFERSRLQDLINHDLSNITQIILTLAESIIDTEGKIQEAEFKLLTDQIERMNTLIMQSRDSIKTSLLAKFDFKNF
ncbi:MAG: hypothetical protein ACFFC7_22200 [Candidatus Hermodarchaeota archaeon]